MIVVDANVIVYTFVEGDLTAQARALFAQDPDWRLPALWRYEFASALATMVRARMATPARSEELLTAALEWVTPFEQEPDPVRALRAARRWDLSAYDAQYVALAEELGARCVTADARLARNATALTTRLAEIQP